MMNRTRNRTAHAACVAHAAPAGGARRWRGWGCGFLCAAALLTSPAIAQQGAIPVPSGQAVVLREVLSDEAPGALWLRFRFIAPEIARDGGSVDQETAGLDMAHLCQTLVVPYLDLHRLDPDRVVISLSDRQVGFGEVDPGATQYFETYRLEDAQCVWERF